MENKFLQELEEINYTNENLYKRIKKIKNEHHKYLYKNQLLEKFSEAEYNIIRAKQILYDLIKNEESITASWD